MDKFLDDLFDILKINSVYSDDVRPFGKGNILCIYNMLVKANKYGFRWKNIDNYCCYAEFGSGKKILGILCHLDVVDVNVDKWHTDPFIPTIIDNKIYARGIQDDKGPLMCAFYAMKELMDEGFKPKKRVRLIMGCNEESGCLCMEKYKEVEEIPYMSFSPDAEYPVIYGEKGILVIKISGKVDSVIKEFHAGTVHNVVPDKAEVLTDKTYTYYGNAAHAMNPYLGTNAICKAIDDLKEKYDDPFINFLDKYFTNDFYGEKINCAMNDSLMNKLTSNLASIHLKDSYFEMIIDYRIPKNICKRNIISNIKNIIKEFNFKIDVIHDMKVHFVNPEGRLVQKLLKAYQENTGDYESKPIAIGGGTYAKCFKNSVAFGTKFKDDEEVCHIDNEYVDIDKLRLNIKIIKDAIKELTK